VLAEFSTSRRSGCCNVVSFKGEASWCPTSTAGAHVESILMKSSKSAVI